MLTHCFVSLRIVNPRNLVRIRPAPPDTASSMANNCDAWELNDAAQAAARLSVAPVVPVAPIQAVPGQEVEVQAISIESVVLPINSGRWKTDLCSCFEDCCSCCAVLWCSSCIPVAQLWERLKGPKGACVKISAVLLAIQIVLAVWSQMNAKAYQEEIYEEGYNIGSRYDTAEAALSSAEYKAFQSSLFSRWFDLNCWNLLLSFVISITLLCMVAKLRAAIRKRDNISETQCLGCEDCCCACWCLVILRRLDPHPLLPLPAQHLPLHLAPYMCGRSHSPRASSCATKASSTANIGSARPPANSSENSTRRVSAHARSLWAS